MDPIINKSQIFCSTPVDNEPPCPPLIANGPNCPQLKDTISWQIDINCAYDIASYQICYAPAGSNSYSQVGSVPAGTFSFIYSGRKYSRDVITSPPLTPPAMKVIRAIEFAPKVGRIMCCPTLSLPTVISSMTSTIPSFPIAM
ncbi:MAG: hypothetical protein IPP46_19235 [Bacteroidetes bacterium]|nr:hypothetical protein [Bacteroidota bacterium]